ncbi:MAG: flotillin-like FloA family protein [Planctomycetaceae bacterium]|nr:flotillin-like FloA family protein [Planctomycetaceae bacterium]
MNHVLAQLNFGLDGATGIAVGIVLIIPLFVAFLVLMHFLLLWIPAYMASADVSFTSLIGMSLRRVPTGTIVTAKIMARQAGLNIDQDSGISTERLEAHYLAGGDVNNVLQAIIVANRAGINLDFDRAAAINLAGRDVLDAVRTSVSPRVIDCPELGQSQKTVLSAVALNGIELLIRVRVTIRTNLEQLIGGATEKTIIARVGHGIISAVGSSTSHLDVLANPDSISTVVHGRGLDVNTAFEIVSINIVSIEVGENIGARLQIAQAEADTRMALAVAESRRAVAIALQQEMTAELMLQRAHMVAAEAEIPAALAIALRAGQYFAKDTPDTLENQAERKAFSLRIAR